MSRRLLSVAVALVGVAVVHLAAASELVVTADRVNLRARPEATSEVVGQVSKGDRLASGGEKVAEWLQVMPPAGADLWVYDELINEGVVAASRVNIRSGPGINYRSIGRLEKGARVTVRDTKGQWLKIAPVPGCSAWVSEEYVKDAATAVAPPAPVPESRPSPATPPTTPTAPRAPTPTPIRRPPVPVSPPAPVVRHSPRGEAPAAPRPVPVATRAPAKASINLRLRSNMPQGEAGESTGVIRPSGWDCLRPAKYRLVAPDAKGRARTVCYVLGDDATWRSLVGQRIQVVGRKYWVTGAEYPAMAVTRHERL